MSLGSRFKVLMAVVLLLVLSVLFVSTSPPPSEGEPQTLRSSRELDEAAEEVRAVATSIRRLEQKIEDQAERRQDVQEALARLSRRVEELERDASQPEVDSPSTAQEDPPDFLEAFDLESLVHEPADSATAALSPAELPFDRALTWIEPVHSSGAPSDDWPAAVDVVQATVDSPKPRFVIPPSILAGLSLTALVGRIPRGGAVQDPWPFVVVSQIDNLTANGVRLPQLRGILWRGVAQGDAVLSCVSASLRSLVYVFDDGVFHVAKASQPEGFGYLTDKAGNPCLPGELHTTAPEQVQAHLLASLVAGAGGAFAENQLQRSFSGGSETANVGEGRAFEFLLGQTVQGAAGAYGDYLQRYAHDVWDAVLVPAGQEIDIHVTAAIPILYTAQQTLHDVSRTPADWFSGGLD